MQYGGFLLFNHSNLEEKYDSGHAYTQLIGMCEGVKVDIPKGFEDASKYNGTLAHKTQHDFNPNGEMRRVILLLLVFLLREIWIINHYVKSSLNNLSKKSLRLVFPEK